MSDCYGCRASASLDRMTRFTAVFEQVEQCRSTQKTMALYGLPTTVFGHVVQDGEVLRQFLDGHRQVRRSMILDGCGPTEIKETRALATVSTSATIPIASLLSCSNRRALRF